MLNDRIIRTTFIISLFGHCLLLGVPGFNINTPRLERSKDISVEIEIENPPLLPKVEVMGNEKKLKEEARNHPPSPKASADVRRSFNEGGQSTETRIESEPQPEEIVIKEPIKTPELPKEKIEVINPAQEAMLRYQDIVKQKIESSRRYPHWAKKQGVEGVSCLVFTVLPNGMVQDIKLIHSSGFDILDKEAILTVKRALPFPSIPAEFGYSSITMEVTFVFKLEW